MGNWIPNQQFFMATVDQVNVFLTSLFGDQVFKLYDELST